MVGRGGEGKVWLRQGKTDSWWIQEHLAAYIKLAMAVTVHTNMNTVVRQVLRSSSTGTSYGHAVCNASIPTDPRWRAVYFWCGWEEKCSEGIFFSERHNGTIDSIAQYVPLALCNCLVQIGQVLRAGGES